MRDFWEKLEDLVGDISKVPFGGFRTDAFSFLLAPILGFLFFLFLILGNWGSIVSWFDKSMAKNSLIVKAKEPLFNEQIRIDWKMDYTRPITVFENGEEVYTDFFEYGNNLFSLYYNDSLMAEIVHFKESNVAGHKYQFHFEMKGKCIIPDLQVSGKYDSLRWVLKPRCN